MVTVTATDDLGNSSSGSDDITSDNTPPAAITDLTATQVKSGNDSDGTTKIRLTFTAPGDAYEVEVYRAGYGDYPEYDDGAGSEPSVPGYAPAAPWVLTGVAASGQTDEPATRDFWYYVVFTKDIAWNVSAVSNKTSGTLNYHLGDVSDGVTPGRGDNYVNSADFSLLGSTYWKSDGEPGYLNYCDVGPTSDLSVDALPTTDDKIDFEDLMMFAINFTTVTFASPADLAIPRVVEYPRLVLQVDERGEEVRDVVVARVVLRGNRRAVKGIHAQVLYDAAGLELVNLTQGELVEAQRQRVFYESLRQNGSVMIDCAVLGARTSFEGSGDVAVLTFRIRGTVVEFARLADVSLRDMANQEISTDVRVVPGSTLAGSPIERLGVTAFPNPFRGTTRIDLSMPNSGRASVQIYDISGRLVRTLVDGSISMGIHSFVWDGATASGDRVAPGTYLLKVRTADSELTYKIVLLP